MNQWKSVTYGEGLFVAVSANGTNRVMTSPDGITWTSYGASNGVELNQWQSVSYGNGVFVAVSDNGTNRVMTSPDGINWTPRLAAAGNPWYSVTYGNGLFVAVAYDGANRVMVSSDNGATWTQPSTAPSLEPWYSVTYGNGVFLAVAWTSNKVMTSTDNGATWTTSTSTVSSVWNSVTYANGVFLAVADTGSSLVKRLDLTPAKPVTTNLRCVNSKTLVDVTVSSEGGSPITHYEYHISTSFPSSQPTEWTAFNPAQNTSPLEWDMQALGYPARVLHYYYVRAVNSFGASVGSWRSNIQESCTNSFRTTTATPTPPAPTETDSTSQSSEPVPSSETKTEIASKPLSTLPGTGMDVKHGIVIAALLWIFGAGLITQARRHFHGPE